MRQSSKGAIPWAAEPRCSHSLWCGQSTQDLGSPGLALNRGEQPLNAASGALRDGQLATACELRSDRQTTPRAGECATRLRFKTESRGGRSRPTLTRPLPTRDSSPSATPPDPRLLSRRDSSPDATPAPSALPPFRRPPTIAVATHAVGTTHTRATRPTLPRLFHHTASPPPS